MGHSSYSKYNEIEESILIINNKGKILYYNESVKEIFDYTYSFPQSVFNLIPEHQLICHKKYIKNNKRGMSNKYIKYETVKGFTKFLNITIIPKNMNKTLIIIKDLTDKTIYEEFFNITENLICATSSDGTFLKVNPYMTNCINYTKDYIFSKTYLFFVHEEDIEKTYKEISSLGAEKQYCTITNRYKTRQDKCMYIRWNIKYIDKNLIVYFGYDISETINLSSELELCQTFLTQTEELMTSGVWDWNVNTNNLILSKGMKNIYEMDDASYMKYILQNHEEDTEKVQNTINKCLVDEQPYTITHRIKTAKTGKIKYLKIRGLIMKILNERRLLGVGQDVTDIIANEKILIELKDKAIKNDNLKSAFIANMSHELRTPLNGIIGITELLKNSSGLTNKQQEYIDTLDNSCGILLSIINNVLDFSKLEKNETSVDISKIEIREFMNNSTKLFKFNVEKKKLYFNLIIEDDVPQFIESDEMKIKQIIYNLLSNAFKFTLNGGISIHVYMKKSNLHIDFKDTGIGIEDDKQKDIFDPFTQADHSTTRKYGGTGLGLSICKSYIRLLNGTISFTSKTNIGSVFSISIPLMSLKHKTDMKKFEGIKYICIVEDNISNQYILKEIIENFSSKILIECFENGRHCLDDISFEYPPSLIFMDLHMPILDGYKCTIQLREKGMKCPIVGISANHMSNEKTKCLNVGMDNFILKPINKKDIQDTLIKYEII